MQSISFPGYEILDRDSALSTPSGSTEVRARHLDTGRLADIRFLPDPFASSNANASDLANKVVAWNSILRRLCQLTPHPHIQRVLDYVECDNGFYLLLEHLEGRTLRQIVESEGARTLEWTLPVCTQIASVLDFAAANRIAHGSLNPDNVILDSVTGDVRLRNFGLQMLQTTLSVNAYIAPEQVAGREGDAHSDVYALGALLYTCLSGRPPFSATNRDDLIQKIQASAPLPLLAQPTWVRDIILRAMQRVPEYRYRVAVDIVNDLTYQRPPAPLSLDTPLAPDDPNQDWSLGRYMPALALHEMSQESEKSEQRGEGTGRRTKKGWFGRGRSERDTAKVPTQPGILIVLLAALLGPFMKGRAQASRGTGVESGAEALNDGAPVHGLLGRFNRYMALQEYVILDPDDPEWKNLKGWRAFLRRFGIRVAVRKTDLDTSRPPRRLIPWPLQRRIQRAVGQTLRIVCIATPVIALALCIHAGMRVQQHAQAWVFRINGHPTVVHHGKKTPLHYGDILDGADMPTLSTDGQSELGLQLADSRVQLAPATTLRIAQMDYSNGARERRLELVSGQAMMMVEPEANRDLPGHYDLMYQDTQVRALPTDSPLTVSVTYHQGQGGKVAVGQGIARVSQQGTHKMVTTGERVATQNGQPLPQPASMSAHDRNTLAAQTAALHPSVATALSSSLPPTISATLSPSLPTSLSTSIAPGLIQPLLSHWVGLYSDVQEKTFMPFVDRALTLSHLKPESQSALDEAKALATARISLDALMKSLVASDVPTTLTLNTLEETGLEAKDRTRILDSFADHHILAYHRLENGSIILLARANNANRTLFKAHDGIITLVPEAEEDKELK